MGLQHPPRGSCAVDPVLAPHLESIGFGIANIGLMFGEQAVVYGLCSPIAGCDPGQARMPTFPRFRGLHGFHCMVEGGHFLHSVLSARPESARGLSGLCDSIGRLAGGWATLWGGRL